MKMEDMSLSGLDNSKLEAIAHEIYTDLVEDACLGLCFEDFEIVDQPGVDIFGQVYNQWKNKECVCPNCSRSIAASRFAPHLEKCLGMGRNSSASPTGVSRQRGWRVGWQQLLQQLGRNPPEKVKCLPSVSPRSKEEEIGQGEGAGGGGVLLGAGGVWGTRRGGHGAPPNAAALPAEPQLAPQVQVLKHKNGEIGGNPDPFKYSNSAGINYETLGPEELRTLLTTQCGVISEHTKKMCTRSLRCPQHTDEQRRSVRVYLLGPSASLPEAESSVENDSFEVAESQALMSRLQWDGSSDISPSDSASSKASTNNSESPQNQEEKTPFGAGERRPGARLQQEEEAQTPRTPHPQHLRRHQL
ncbi:unnamed protein product, partial [Bubo scandiacus]